jgi:probable rRNA maturation factor
LEALVASSFAEGEIDLDLWRDRLLDALVRCGLPEETELSAVFVDDSEIRRLNARWRGIDRPTEVLSFPLEDEGSLGPTARGWPAARVIGDIVVSVETARRQAAELGHSLDRELGFLLVHGLLHLLGEDHETPEEDERMRARQRKLLAGWRLER